MSITPVQGPVQLRAITTTVRVTVNDREAVSRCFTDEWRSSYYRFDDEGEVIDHFAYNAVANGIEDASRLDGWADLPPGAVVVEILDREVEQS